MDVAVIDAFALMRRAGQSRGSVGAF